MPVSSLRARLASWLREVGRGLWGSSAILHQTHGDRPPALNSAGLGFDAFEVTAHSHPGKIRVASDDCSRDPAVLFQGELGVPGKMEGDGERFCHRVPDGV